jgi:hypothetical protein
LRHHDKALWGFVRGSFTVWILVAMSHLLEMKYVVDKSKYVVASFINGREGSGIPGVSSTSRLFTTKSQ